MSILPTVVSVVAAPVFLFLGWRFPRTPRPLLRTGLHADLIHALVNGPVLDALVAYAAHTWSPGFLGVQPYWLQAVVLLVVGDLVKWTMYMLHHKVPLLWRLHRLHHCTREMDALSADDPRAVDKNFGGFLSIWDWIFGTASCPDGEKPTGFGIAEMPTPPTTYFDHLRVPVGDRIQGGGWHAFPSLLPRPCARGGRAGVGPVGERR